VVSLVALAVVITVKVGRLLVLVERSWVAALGPAAAVVTVSVPWSWRPPHCLRLTMKVSRAASQEVVLTSGVDCSFINAVSSDLQEATAAVTNRKLSRLLSSNAVGWRKLATGSR
jgi:hypothetical protein